MVGRVDGMSGPQYGPLVLSSDERRTLEAWARGDTTSDELAVRSRIVLACAGGAPDAEVAAELGVSRYRVNRWRRQFMAGGLAGIRRGGRICLPFPDQAARQRADDSRQRG